MTLLPARRICWPDPDATCLEGGCLHCNDHQFRSLTSIYTYAQSAGQVSNRHGGKTKDARDAYRTGLCNGWFNAESRYR